MNETKLSPEEQQRIKELGDTLLAQREDQLFTFSDPLDARMPIVSEGVMEQIKAGMAAVKYTHTWKQWGFKDANTVLLLEGDSGLGKTTTALWIGKALDKSVLSISHADIGSEKPGQSERRIGEAFAAATRRRAILFIDEADGLIVSRKMLGKDDMWRVSVINCFLQSLEKYDGIVILATNNPSILDSAMNRRIAYTIHFEMPDEKARKRLWRALWPKWPLPYGENESKINNLAKSYHLSGAQIEVVIKNAARKALKEERKPTMDDLWHGCSANS